MKVQPWLKDLAIELMKKINQVGLDYYMEEKVDKLYVIQEFFQKSRTVPFFVLMSTTDLKADGIFLPPNDYQIACDMQHLKMYSPNIVIIRENEEFSVVIIEETSRNKKGSEKLAFKNITGVADFIFILLENHMSKN